MMTGWSIPTIIALTSGGALAQSDCGPITRDQVTGTCSHEFQWSISAGNSNLQESLSFLALKAQRYTYQYLPPASSGGFSCLEQLDFIPGTCGELEVIPNPPDPTTAFATTSPSPCSVGSGATMAGGITFSKSFMSGSATVLASETAGAGIYETPPISQQWWEHGWKEKTIGSAKVSYDIIPTEPAGEVGLSVSISVEMVANALEMHGKSCAPDYLNERLANGPATELALHGGIGIQVCYEPGTTAHDVINRVINFRTSLDNGRLEIHFDDGFMPFPEFDVTRADWETDCTRTRQETTNSSLVRTYDFPGRPKSITVQWGAFTADITDADRAETRTPEYECVPYCSRDFNGDGEFTDQDIEAFFACWGGTCCATCLSPDINHDGDLDDRDIEAFFRLIGGGAC